MVLQDVPLFFPQNLAKISTFTWLVTRNHCYRSTLSNNTTSRSYVFFSSCLEKKLFFCYVTGTNSPNPKPTHLRKCFIMFHDLSKKLLFIKKREADMAVIWLFEKHLLHNLRSIHDTVNATVTAFIKCNSSSSFKRISFWIQAWLWVM